MGGARFSRALVKPACGKDRSIGQLARACLSRDYSRNRDVLLRCSGVTKSYVLGEKRVQALDGVDLSIERHGFYGIMGASGSGKSTLLHLLAALDHPDAGEIEVAGQRVDRFSEAEATVFRRTKIGIVFQQFNLIPTLTARENVELPGLLAGDDDAATREKADSLMRRLGVLDRAHHRPDALSGGEQQRVAIARALLFSPGVIFADEPTGNLDSASSARLWRLLSDLAEERQMLVLMVTHEPAAATNCRSVFVLADGKVKAIMETEGLDAAGIAARYQQYLQSA